MSRKRYTDEFKDEASKQVIEYGRPARDSVISIFASLSLERQDVARLTVEHVADFGESFESYAANLPGSDKRQVLLR